MHEDESDGQIEAVPAVASGSRVLTAPEFQGLAAMPAEMEWFAKLNKERLNNIWDFRVKQTPAETSRP